MSDKGPLSISVSVGIFAMTIAAYYTSLNHSQQHPTFLVNSYREVISERSCSGAGLKLDKNFRQCSIKCFGGLYFKNDITLTKTVKKSKEYSVMLLVNMRKLWEKLSLIFSGIFAKS
jgi:hypothetical protein